MTSSHQSITTSFKPRRRPQHNKQPSPTTTKQPILKCPRCDSFNTKFCYYNNYSLSQPRHYCKNCRRYWTRGGSLRNVPIGGGSTRNKNKPYSDLHVISSSSPHHELLVDGFCMNREILNPSSTAMMMNSGGFSGYMIASSSNQDLHQKFQQQQQRLISSMLLQQYPLTVMFQNVELIPPSTDCVFERSVGDIGGGGAPSGSNENNAESEGNLGNWYHNADLIYSLSNNNNNNNNALL